MSHIWGGNCDRKIGFTLRVGGRRSGIDDRRNWDMYRVDGRVVTLRPKQGLKMMGFPSTFRFPVSETDAMKQLGNSVAVNAIEAVARSIITALKESAAEGRK
jgi:DNA (cytosine-5)-methyltransferase 1